MKAVTPQSDPSHSLPEHGVGILNGMFGDCPQRRGNDLAANMCFRYRRAEAEITRTEQIHRSIPRYPYSALSRIGPMPVFPGSHGDAS